MQEDLGVHSISFNQDNSCFGVGLDQGCQIFNVNPLRRLMNLPHDEVGSIYLCEMLGRTNLVAIVAGGELPKFADNTVLLWDDKQRKFVLELTFDLPVLNVKLRRSKLFVVTRNKIHVFSFPTKIEKLFTIETSDNAKGLCVVSSSQYDRQLLAFPGPRPGTVQILDLSKLNQVSNCTSRSPTVITAHKSDVSCLALSTDSSMLATASKKGTLIRIWDTATNALKVELRRGMEPAKLYSIGFSPDSEKICTSSDRGTCHIFAVRQTDLNWRMPSVPRSIGNLFKNPISECQWGFSNFQIPSEVNAIVGFTSTQELVALTFSGNFYKYQLRTPNGGPCQCSEFDQFIAYRDQDWKRYQGPQLAHLYRRSYTETVLTFIKVTNVHAK